MALNEGSYGLDRFDRIDSSVLAEFSCGKPHLDSFLKSRAEFFHQEHLATAWIVFHRDIDYPVGYFTLHNDSLELTSSEEGDLGLSDHAELKRFPAITIGRLAVDKRLHRTGCSDQVMRLAMSVVMRSIVDRISAARILVVDADNESRVLKFYERHGFQRSDWADKQAKHQGGRQGRSSIKMLRDILTPLAP